MVFTLLTGCAGTAVVYYNDCTCGEEAYIPAEGAVKTGLAMIANMDESASVTEEADGKAAYNVSLAAVLVDDKGVIVDCVIDSVSASLAFDGNGAILSDVEAAVPTKNELGDQYGMKKIVGSKYEWYEQAQALADYAVGKTVSELRTGAVNESGKAADADLASVATISLGDYVDAIEAAAANAAYLGAQAGDELRLAVTAALSDSAGAQEGKDGTAQLNCDAAAVTVLDGVITGCVIDSVQAKVTFGVDGQITCDVAAIPQTKNQLGEAYNMKLYGGAKYEWNEQAASFCAYITGKTFEEVASIAVNETSVPTDADLASTVTIKIGGFQTLIQKAA